MRVNKNALILPCFNYVTLLLILLLATSIIRVPLAMAETSKSTMLVYKNLTCSCCDKWINHIKEAGFSVTVKPLKNINRIKKQFNIAPENHACHTGVLQGYAFEGHIPASVIRHFLREKPNSVIGLAVPGMPTGSPGMDNGRAFSPYKVYQLNKEGGRTPYATISFDKTVYEGRET